ncbi:hypothetical protein SteCoe_21815 [Stentor coeruleus]|uniref:RING-type domain-containing protein n=1 Tax=Stentor coeruleus TaxID=5963 RepID=A0A1R2BNI0_9CILI|nr:hypothetical protein SteCoe_21815 [Stentor coeruleus]
MGSILLGGFLLLFGISIVLLYKRIAEWLMNIFSPNPEPQESNQQRQQSSIKKHLKTFHSSLFLSRISSTFYKTVKKRPQKVPQKEAENNNSVKECLICCADESDGVIMPCGHSGICYNCGLKLLEDGKDCHICRKKIESILKVDKKESKVIIATEVENEQG